MAVLEVRGLTRYYGSNAAINDVDLTTEEGELVAILGPSGSGKTTLMRLVAGLERPSNGDILVNGQSVVGIPPRKRDLAMVFQSYALYPHMSVRDNILFPLKSHRVPKSQWPDKLEWATDILGITHLLERRPARLSGGESQRVALARCLVRDPELFVLDEPLSALDAQVRHSARAELRDLQKRTGTTTLYVTHDQIEALGLGHRVVVMRHGTMQQVGTPEDLYFEPVNTFVAAFIGTPPMNLIDRGDDLLGIRAEHLVDRDHAANHDETSDFPIEFDQLEFLGTEWFGYGFYIDGDRQSRVIVRLPQSEGESYETGQRYAFVAPHRHIKYFDSETGQRISERAPAAAS